ncbi:predicted protein [Nematostella vectensis]|uniref:SCP domain-containing protein n=1 Tax=Nematostella vectensis TaxID=45351 RepID=A7SA39_NEMVE|nr:predicted protein [Nematostella vectensis]|eukprot:XP_001631455.1 predicted protein [Nematostella vectensis]
MNKYRMLHASPPLRINYDMTNKAELWAVKLANKDQSSLNVDTKYGQALFVSDTPADVVNASVRSWYNQIRFYNYNNPVRKAKTSFFMQLIWMNSQEVGVGKASSASGKTYIVAYFDPPSNTGDIASNVLPVTGELGILWCKRCT